jgi:DNA-binding transcriptional LysR family regulator
MAAPDESDMALTGRLDVAELPPATRPTSTSDVDPRLIRAFFELSHDLSFTQAANRLGVSQPHFSTRIQQLEDQIGFKLIRRSTRRVQLTEKGRAFLAYAVDAIDALDRTARAADMIRSGFRDHLTIGASAYRAAERWSILNRFLAHHGELNIHVINERTPQLLAKLRSGDVELVFGYGPSPADCRRLLISDHPVGVVLAKTSPLASDCDVEPFLLRDRRVYVFPREIDRQLHARLIHLLNESGVYPLPLPEANAEAARALIRQSDGLLVTTQWWTDEQPEDDFVFRTLHGFGQRLEFGLFSSKLEMGASAGALWNFVARDAKDWSVHGLRDRK